MGAPRADVAELIVNLNKRNILGIYCEDKNAAHKKILEFISESATIGFAGSQTLEQLEIVEMLESRGNLIYNQYDPQLSRDESMKIRKQGTLADYYLTSANAVSKQGELFFLSAYGHRIAGIADAKNVIVVVGINKLAESFQSAMDRARKVATPLNCKRLKWDTPCVVDGVCRSEICFSPQFVRMCCQWLIIESEMNPDRMTVLIVGEELGF
jgi:arginine repressor